MAMSHREHICKLFSNVVNSIILLIGTIKIKITFVNQMLNKMISSLFYII